MLTIALGVRFALELCLLSTAAWAASQLFSWPYGVGSAVAALIALAMLWGILLSPKRRVEIGHVPRLVLEFSLFIAAAWLLLRAGHAWLAAWLLVIEVAAKAAVERLQRGRVRL
jgi:hypothetical protein